MLKGRDIICISSIDWEFVWQGHQEIMSAFAKNGNRVLFIENTGTRAPGVRDASRLKKRFANWLSGIKGFRQIRDNLYIYSPVILPFPYSSAGRWLNRNFLFGPLRKWLKLMDFRDAVVWTFLPTGTALDIIDEIDHSCIVYYCIADFNELVKRPAKLYKTESAMIAKCDVIFAQGRVLEEKCRRFNKNVHIFPFGVNMTVFSENAMSGPDTLADMLQVKKPVIGYVGGLHRHIDFELVKFLASRRPEWSFVLIGPRQTDVSALEAFPNIYFLGKKDFGALPSYISGFDVSIIPYAISEFTRTVYPTKLNEYHALGKPVVATDLPEVVAFNERNSNLVYIARNREEFLAKIETALSQKNDPSAIKRRIDSAKMHSWDVRIEQMSELICEAMDRMGDAQFDWQRRYKELYRKLRRRFFKVSLSFLALWAVIFYTPLIWLIASPLKISNVPEKADAIVVFAGGVGESGIPGQGYQERVEYAADLYKKGFSSRLIFSSGTQSRFPEPYVMKALAVSIGINASAIIIEDKSASTYENVKFTSMIAKQNDYKKIILVSSPYHMRRSMLTFRRQAPDLAVVFCPVPRSSFYARRMDKQGRASLRQAYFQQIRGIAHEYLAIIYYRLKLYL